jgi:hypothetical protein
MNPVRFPVGGSCFGGGGGGSGGGSGGGGAPGTSEDSGGGASGGLRSGTPHNDASGALRGSDGDCVDRSTTGPSTFCSGMSNALEDADVTGTSSEDDSAGFLPDASSTVSGVSSNLSWRETSNCGTGTTLVQILLTTLPVITPMVTDRATIPAATMELAAEDPATTTNAEKITGTTHGQTAKTTVTTVETSNVVAITARPMTGCKTAGETPFATLGLPIPPVITK